MNKPVFNEFSLESLRKINEQILNEKSKAEIEKQEKEEKEIEKAKEEQNKRHRKAKGKSPEKEIDPSSIPNKDFEVGKELSKRFRASFPEHLFGVPIEDIDPFYQKQYVEFYLI